MSTPTTYKFFANTIHCKSCTILIEENLKDVPGVRSVTANEYTKAVEVVSDLDQTPENYSQILTKYIEKDGYELSLDPKTTVREWKDFYFALPIALLVATIFVLIQKIGLANLINADKVSYPIAFIIGLVASVSTCLAVVGGLLLSVSANYAKAGKSFKPQMMFHSGRLISFFVLGGVIGLIGGVFTLNIHTTVFISILVALVMMILGLNLLNVFPWAEKLQIRMPGYFMRKAAHLRSDGVWLAPFLIGISTFFLPCGFTQSMQLYALSTGNYITGALIMLVFALGTMPVLALISFTSFSLGKGKTSSIFFKTAGLLVIVFALINILNNLAIMGLIKPVINF